MGPRPLDAIARLADACGPKLIVQIRERDLPARDILQWIDALLPLAERSGCLIMVNARVDVALCFGTVGVHLPEAGLPIEIARELLGPTRRIGASRHTADGARDAAHRGADLVTISPIFASPKFGVSPPTLGVAGLEETVAAVGAEAAVKHVVTGVAGEDIVEGVAGGVDVGQAGEGQVLEIVA